MDTEFNWQNCWYPVVFVEDLPKRKPYAFSLYNEPMVLFRNEKGDLACAADRCPHRAARLSDGHLIDGKLECLYHGWQFNAAGECTRIPQLAPDKKIPATACLKSHVVVECQGMVWVWVGAPDLAAIADIPSIVALDNPDVISVDYTIDLPYDQTYLIENVIDVAHIHIAHHGLRGGGHRDYALPLEFDILEDSVKGIRATYRSIGLNQNRDEAKTGTAHLDFIAPNLISYTSKYQKSELIAGLALYSIPLAKGKCRLLYRKYSNFYSWRERIKPKWLDHWNQNEILQQDMALIIGQYSEIERSQQNAKDLWLPIKSSDTLVIHYRKWLDKYAAATPFYRGYATHKTVPHLSDQHPYDVFSIHTQNCTSCLRAYRFTKQLQKIVIALILILLPLLFVFAGAAYSHVILFSYLGLVLMTWVTQKIRLRFE
ncbi:MAG: Rieske 2Fe-2S domain-containing protein [Methyloglobulus sp.]|nr:Rieske 2Fe-2S domain-containing protein [Methyloglobulus sp.]